MILPDPATIPDNAFYGTYDIALLFNVAEKTVRGWVKEGYLMSHNPMQIRIKGFELKRFINQRNGSLLNDTI